MHVCMYAAYIIVCMYAAYIHCCPCRPVIYDAVIAVIYDAVIAVIYDAVIVLCAFKAFIHLLTVTAYIL